MPAGIQHAAALAWRVPSALRGGGESAPSLVEVRPAGAPGSRRTECAHSEGRRRAAPDRIRGDLLCLGSAAAANTSPGGSGKGSLLASWLSTTGHKISSIGSWILGASTFFFLYNVYKAWKYGERVTRDDPWGLRRLAGVGHLVPAPATQRHQDPADPVRAARVRPALPARPDRPHPQARPTCEHLAFCVSIVAVMRLRFAIRRGQAGACRAPFLPGTRDGNQPAGQAFLLLGTDQGAQIGDDRDVR